MSDRDQELRDVHRAADDIIPSLTERLARHGLGELEVRDGSLRVRVAGTPKAIARPERDAPSEAVAPVPTASGDGADPAPATPAQGVTSPAVGFFVYADGLGPGLAVEKGDALGHVEMLGVRHDVRAPRSGTVRNLVTERGEPVEYGQLLIELEPAG
jgi:biotin carboxyl carrier protein